MLQKINKVLIPIILLFQCGILYLINNSALMWSMYYCIFCLCTISFTIYIFAIKNKSKIFNPIFLFLIVFPLFAALSSSLIFKQPFIMGLLSMRNLFFLTFMFYLFLSKYPYQLLIKQINTINITIIILSIVLFIVFQIPDYFIQRFMFSFNSIEANLESSGDAIRGDKFRLFTAFLPFSFAYYQLKVLDKAKLKYILINILFLFYIIFVNKGRGLFLNYGLLFIILVYKSNYINLSKKY